MRANYRRGGGWRRLVETVGGDGWWRRLVETVGGDGWWINDEEEKTNIDDRYRCLPHPGLQG